MLPVPRRRIRLAVRRFAIPRAATGAAAFLGTVVVSGVLAAPGQATCRNVWQAYPSGESALVLVCDNEPVGGGSSKPKKKPSSTKNPTKAQYRALRYVPRTSVSAGVRDELADAIAAGPNEPAIRAEVQSGVYMRDFRTVVRKQHWSTRDFADQYTMGYIMLWMIVRNRDTVSDAVAKAVRNDLRKRLALDSSVRRARDATKQAHIERLASWTVLLTSDRNRAAGDDDALERVQRSARDFARQPSALGVDLANVMLSRKGVLRTSGGPRLQR